MKNKINELSEKIIEAQSNYYNGSAIISDDEYDALVYELSCLDSNNPILFRIGSEPTEEWKKEKHNFPLGSLNKVNTPQEMIDWLSKNPNKQIVISEKLDGLSIGCQYENGKLVKAILRGNGLEGENILPNVLKMHGIVKYIPNFSGTLRGEIILTKSNHQKYFSDYANPRNAASGLCRRLDSEGCQHLTVLFYQVLSNNMLVELESTLLSFLSDWGCLVPNYKLCSSANEVNKLWQDYQDNIRSSLDYEIDGLVASYDDIPFQISLGEINMRPKGKIAMKFANQFISTMVKEITWNTGSMGRLTPICWFEPVNLLGSTVEKASVYNIAYIKSLGLDVGAQVLICKANEIIPRVEKVIRNTGTVAIPPNNCPECNSKLKMDGEYLICPNIGNCSAQVAGRIQNWVNELNLLEWGSMLLERLVDDGLVQSITDLYTLSIDQLSNVERMGKKSAKKCLDILHANTELDLDIFIGGLSIPMIGSSTIRLLIAEGFDTIEKIRNMSVEQMQNTSGIGPGRANSLHQGLIDNSDLIDDLLDHVTIKKKVIGNLTGMKIAITGATVNKRAVLEKLIADHGGEYKSSVSKTCTHLVIADVNSSSSKAVAARKLGIKLMSEEELLEKAK